VALSASRRTELGLSAEIKYLSVDGAHRTAALRFLIASSDPRDAAFTEDYTYRVHVLHNYTDAMQRALSSRKCLVCVFFFFPLKRRRIRKSRIRGGQYIFTIYWTPRIRDSRIRPHLSGGQSKKAIFRIFWRKRESCLRGGVKIYF
jgi:hypothetical protein